MEQKREEKNPTQTLVLANSQQTPKKVVCDMCGYANSEYTSICKMCSNYLKGEKNV